MTDTDSTLQNLRKLALAAFSMPAAVGLLDKYESSLGISDLLKRIVRNYEAILAAVWDWLKAVLPLPPDIDIQFWSFFILILTPALVEWARHAVQGRKMVFSRPGFWGIASAVAFAGYCIAFSTGGQLIGTAVEAAVFLIAFIPFVLVLVLVIIWFEDRLTRFRADAEATEQTGKSGPFVLVRLAAYLILFFAFTEFTSWVARPLTDWVYGLLGAERYGGTRGIALLASICLMAVFAFGNLRTPAYVFFWLFGIVLIDTLAADVLPSINDAIDRAICAEGNCG